MLHVNIRRPNIEPCGTPLLISPHSHLTFPILNVSWIGNSYDPAQLRPTKMADAETTEALSRVVKNQICYLIRMN